MDDAERGELPSVGLVAGRFRLGGLLGTGGSASVFQAVDTTTGVSVAVKLLHPHLAESEPLREAFLDEARRARDISHPHIVEMIDVGTYVEDDVVVVWIAQELVPGVTLAEHVRGSGALSASECVTVADALLAALQHAHEAGLVHRDVSPSNVMVVIDDTSIADVKLLDFGLADIAGATTLGGDVLRSAASAGAAGVVGNVRFASPEQLRGEAIDERGDIYQVGAVLYFALTGRAPFESGDRAGIVRAHLGSPPPVPSVRARGLPAELDRLVVRALLKEPDDRYPDAATMRSALSTVPVHPQIAGATTVTRVWASPARTSSTAPTSSSAPSTEPASAGSPAERTSTPWVLAASVVALLAAVAIAVPLLVPAGGSQPQPTSTAAAPREPSPSPTVEPTSVAVLERARAVVPGLGMLADVVASLERIGLVAGEISFVDSSVSADTVLAMDPAPGASVDEGTSIMLTVASGSNAIPVVAGLSETEALEAVRASGFTAATVKIAASEPAGTVLGIEPGAGTSQPLGAVVRVLTSAGRPSDPTPTPTPTDLPTPLPTRTAST